MWVPGDTSAQAIITLQGQALRRCQQEEKGKKRQNEGKIIKIRKSNPRVMQGPPVSASTQWRVGIPTGSKGTFGLIFLELQSQNLQKNRTWLIVCREVLQPRKEEERKAGKKQSRRTSWLTPPSQNLHPPMLTTTGQCPWGCFCCHRGGSCLPIPPLPRLCPGSASGCGFLCEGEGMKLEWKSLDVTWKIQGVHCFLLFLLPRALWGLLQVSPLSPFLQGYSPPGCPFSSQ